MTELSESLEHKRDALLELLTGYGRVAVAFSAGVDSTVVAKAAQLACGENAVAVTSVSFSLAEGEKEEAERLARLIGIRHQFVETAEFNNPDYLKNAPDRCYFCKTELFTLLEGMQSELGVDVVVSGANVDDQGDYRPGMQAGDEHGVRKPLIEAGFDKSEVRLLAEHWNLPIWDKPATPCLSSRIAYGLAVTPQRLERVDRAEQFLRREFGLQECRVRHEFNDLARIEVPENEIARCLAPEARQKLAAHLHELGFKYVSLDLDGFRSGSMNAVLPLESLQELKR